MTNPRDWDKEMADIDKLMASDKAPAPNGLPSGGAVARSGSASPASSPSRSGGLASRPRDAFGVWLKVLLGALGGAALFYWPYGKSCGPMLYAYLVGVLAVSAAGIWSMRGAWTHRRGWALVIGMLVFLLGCGLAAAEILPRVGYAAVAHSWTCS